MCGVYTIFLMNLLVDKPESFLILDIENSAILNMEEDISSTC